MAIIVVGTVVFPIRNIPLVREHLLKLSDLSRSDFGCIAYDVAQDIRQSGLIRFSEIWSDAEALAAHLATSHIAEWRITAGNLGAEGRKFSAFEAEKQWLF